MVLMSCTSEVSKILLFYIQLSQVKLWKETTTQFLLSLCKSRASLLIIPYFHYRIKGYNSANEFAYKNFQLNYVYRNSIQSILKYCVNDTIIGCKVLILGNKCLVLLQLLKAYRMILQDFVFMYFKKDVYLLMLKNVL